MRRDPAVLEALRAQVARLEAGACSHAARSSLAFGLPAIDAVLPGGGLALGALHELGGAGPDTEHGAAPALLAASLAGRLPGMVIWIVGSTSPFLPALAAVGLNPGRLVFVRTRSEVLQIMEDCVRQPGLGSVIGEVSGEFGLTASRRIQLAAEGTGVTAFALRLSRRFDDPLLDAPNAALTRWRVQGVPSPPAYPDDPNVLGVGRLRWRLELRRARGGVARSWIVDGPDAAGQLALPASMAASHEALLARRFA